MRHHVACSVDVCMYMYTVVGVHIHMCVYFSPSVLTDYNTTNPESTSTNPNNMAHRTVKTFDNDKASCLGIRDKSFAGRIDVKAVEICRVINERQEYYTLSICSGRCFLYQGHGIKSSTFLEGQENRFQRWRISHDWVKEAVG